ncbi:hypothetical protein Bca4012_077590 [Brassica carinata]
MVQFQPSSGSISRLYVRKNVQDGGVPVKKRRNTENDSKETREENVHHCSSQESICEKHLKEIEELKEKLKAKEREVEAMVAEYEEANH